MKFNGNNWISVGLPAFSPGKADYVSLALAANNIPYVAFCDINNAFKATAMKYDIGVSTSNTFIKDNALSIYPNPAKDFIVFSKWIDEKLKVEIIDVTGKIVASEYLNSKNTTLNTADFTNGIYLVKVENGTHITYHKLIIK